jgi:hypothetical protein
VPWNDWRDVSPICEAKGKVALLTRQLGDEDTATELETDSKCLALKNFRRGKDILTRVKKECGNIGGASVGSFSSSSGHSFT